MKFKILACSSFFIPSLFCSLFLGLDTKPASAADCSKIVTVPFSWQLTQTTGNGKNNISLFLENDGPFGNVESSSANLAGKFTISKVHNPPANFCSVLDPLPTTTILDIVGKLDGTYANSTLGFDIKGLLFETYVKANAGIDILPAFTPESFGTGAGTINQTQSAVKTVGVGDIPYAGTLNGQTKFGFGGENLDFITALVQLRLGGNLRDNEPIFIRYKIVTVNEPSTISAIFVVFGFSMFMKRKFKVYKNAKL